MGSCVCKSSQGSAMKGRMGFAVKTTADVAIPPSPIKDKSDTFDHNPVKSQSLSPADSGSKDDTFFDSQTWLEFDCEDEFVSVNGDSAPSSGNTPGEHSLSKATNYQVNTTAALIRKPSAKENRKKLADLFKERVKQDQSEDHEDRCLAPKFAGTAPRASGIDNLLCSSERTANGDVSMNKVKTTQGCLTGLVSCRSLSERKGRLSPAIVVTEKA